MLAVFATGLLSFTQQGYLRNEEGSKRAKKNRPGKLTGG